MTHPETVVELRDISKRFQNLQALSHINFDLRKGETHALVGENGAGKSTLMRILSGVYTEYEGDFILRGDKVKFHSPRDALNQGIGMIHQELTVMPELSVAENLFLGWQPTNRLRFIDWKRMNELAKQELEQLGFDDVDVRKPLGNFPLGTQQVVEILRVMMSGAQVLIMDEPTSALSPGEIERLIELIDTLRRGNRSIIYISHFLDEVMQVADRITVLRDGHKIATLEQDETNVDELVSLILGHQIQPSLSRSSTAIEKGEVLLTVADLKADVFDNISFDVKAGEVVGIYGAIGAGHFDLARAIFGIYRLDSGNVIINGHKLPRNFSPAYAIKRGLAYATESRRKTLMMDEAIYRNVSMPHLNRVGKIFPIAKREIAVAEKAIARVNVQPANPLNAVGKLSGGNQQKVVIARWLAFPPKVFIMSEPTRGMDVGAKDEVMSIISDFRDQGYGILIISSEPESVLHICDRIIVMSHGEIVSELPNENLNKDILMRLL